MLDAKPDARVQTSVRAKVKRAVFYRKSREIIHSFNHYFHELSRLRSPRDLADWIYYKSSTKFPLRSYPPVVNIELTNVCNFSCRHCHRPVLNVGRMEGYMSLGTLEKIVRESRSRASRVKLIGLGEPALHPELDAIMKFLKGSGLKTQLFTNGTLFEKYDAQTILSWEVDEIVVSVDGTDARSYERIRCGGCFETLVDDVKAFRAERDRWRGWRPYMQVRHVLMPNETSEALADFAHFWRGQFVDSVNYCFLSEPFDRPRTAATWRPSCRDIRREMHIRYDGRVPLCGYAGHGEWLGSVASTSVEQIWNCDRLAEVRRLHQAHDLSALGFCKTCQFW
jgi:MoaA/NifB/PqqE/SkfB family radical SAM enzyme